MPDNSRFSSGGPQPPKNNDIQSYQRNFVGGAALVGIFAVPSARYAIEKNVSRVKDIENPVVRGLTSDALTIAGYSALVSGAGKLFINQDLASGAKLGLKISFALVCVYEVCRIAKYTADQTGLTDYLPKCGK